MDALTFVNQFYDSTDIKSNLTTGLKCTSANNLDCNCVDGDCSTETYEY